MCIQTTLTASLAAALSQQSNGLPVHIRLIELNKRSLVGGLRPHRRIISTEFVDELVAWLD
jgi:hypothetical protein